MLTELDIKQLIAQGEGFNLEFKESLPSKASDLAEEIVAFANAAGGTILVGVKDNAQIVGITLDNTQRSRLQNILNAVDPPLEVTQHQINVDGRLILCLQIASGAQKPYTVSGKIFIRQGANAQKIISSDKMRDFFQQADRLFFDEQAAKDIDWQTDFDDKMMNTFLLESGISSTLPHDLLRSNLQLNAPNHQPKNGAVLFFGSSPQQYFPQSFIRCLLFKGTDKTTILDDKMMEGPLYDQYTGALAYLRQKLNLRYEIVDAGPRIEQLEIPEVVLREALVNALCHRDYTEKGAGIMVEIYDDRMVISNPGGLVTSIAKTEFGQRSLSRNPLIFGLFQRMRLVEKVGSGISRMKTAMKEAKLPEPDFKLEGMFGITLYRPVDFQQWLESSKKFLRKTHLLILPLLHQHPEITTKEMAAELGITTRTVDRGLKELRDLGILERLGSDRAGQYSLVLKSLT